MNKCFKYEWYICKYKACGCGYGYRGYYRY